MSSEKLIATLQEGLKNEFDGALNYTFLASKTGDYDLRRTMLHYASEEIKHAVNLLSLLEKLEAHVEDLSPELTQKTDILDFMVNYQAKEEAAIFYYQVLTELLDDPVQKKIFKNIQGEEKEHYRYIKELINKTKGTNQNHA